MACSDGGERLWRADAALEVALAVRATYPSACLVVDRVVGAPPSPMPFALYQALVTGGFVVDSVRALPRPGTLWLSFKAASVEGAVWTFETALSRGAVGEPEPAEIRRWRVDCEGGACRALESGLNRGGGVPAPAPEACAL